MAPPWFTDRNQPPTDESIVAVLGRAAGAWTQLFSEIRAQHPDVTGGWRYYDDGHSWLLKAARRSTTIFWLSVESGAFRVTFYFPERLAGALLASDLDEERKAEIRSTAPTGKLRRVSVLFGPRRGVHDVMALIALKKTLR